ncbi:MAG: chorismate mutase [Pseudobdellovibrionaceae bacterium]
MDALENLRLEIDKIHEELRELLLRRRDLTLAIWKIKKENNYPFITPQREAEILEQFLSHPDFEKDPEFREAMAGIMNSILDEYKKYLLKKHS